MYCGNFESNNVCTLRTYAIVIHLMCNMYYIVVVFFGTKRKRLNKTHTHTHINREKNRQTENKVSKQTVSFIPNLVAYNI